MTLAPADAAAYASDIGAVFGTAAAFFAPRDAREAAKMRERVAGELDAIRPHADGPSVGEALRSLCDHARRGWPERSRAARQLAELHALFEQAAFRRSKRAERGRLFAQLIVLFGLEPAAGLAPADDAIDGEAHLKHVRRSLRGR